MTAKKRAIVLVLDSFGIGAAPDADKFGDTGSDTLGHIAELCAAGKAENGRQGYLHLPNLASLGLLHAAKACTGRFPEGMTTDVTITGAYAPACEISSGKDTPSGHWEMAGVPVLFDWGYFTEKENTFPPELLEKITAAMDLPGILGDCHASGTEIIARLGEEHMRTGKPILYTSADSVLQIACHEESFGLDRLLKLCEVSRELLEGYNIGRVIARPFIGTNSSDFERTGNRRDYSLTPPSPTVLDKLANDGGEVVSIGKIADIYAHQGITQKIKATGLEALFDVTLEEVRKAGDHTIVMTNFVDFDMHYGHRRDVTGYAEALEYFDRRLPELLAMLEKDDILILTADHGCDPTWHGSDHTREHVPVLVYGPTVKPGSLGVRETFADIGQTLAAYFDLPAMDHGTSFLPDIMPETA
ncbi:MAG: phosphopentomutase [Oceanospirillales bacterium LUC14_002_19_P2]|nr:MAG: phosphopentomutase [Oceanospirillales bacterium LUC14_002_19_P2]